jgi:hypothetical protein
MCFELSMPRSIFMGIGKKRANSMLVRHDDEGRSPHSGNAPPEVYHFSLQQREREFLDLLKKPTDNCIEGMIVT